MLVDTGRLHSPVARNQVDKYRREKAKRLPGNDATVLMDYFEKKMRKDPPFFFSYNFDKDGRLVSKCSLG